MPGDGKQVWVKIWKADILYVRGSSNYVYLQTARREYCTHLSIGTLADSLPASCFVRVHRSYIVHLAHVARVDANTVTLENGTQLPIGDHYKAALRKAMVNN